MNYNKKTIYDVDVKGKKVLLRCDFNVPQNKETGEITSDKRIVAAIPTIKYLLEQGAAVIACSHLGKPKGEWKTKLTLAPVAKRLSELLGQEVIFAADIIGEDAQAKAAALQPGQILLLENLRFDIREEKNGADFAKALADMAEIFVSDAFGTVHRAHASTAGIAAYLPAVSGFLIGKELDIMGKALEDPARPFVAILGGAKVSDKIAVIENLLTKVDKIIIGGGMAYTFVKAQGFEVGNSLLEADKVDFAKEMIERAKANGVEFLLPVDTVVGDKFAADAEAKTVAIDGIEVMAVIFAKKINLTVGTFMMCYNVILYVIAGVILRSWTLPLYSIVTYYVALNTIDFIVEGIDRSKAVMIITDKADKVSAALIGEFGSGTTKIPARGGFTNKEKGVIYFVVNRFQISRMRTVVHNADPRAYITISDVADIYRYEPED